MNFYLWMVIECLFKVWWWFLIVDIDVEEVELWVEIIGWWVEGVVSLERQWDTWLKEIFE